jgi:hypothetical protein
MKNNKKSKLSENVLRTMLRKEIAKILEAEEVEKETEETPEEEPEEQEDGLNADLDSATNLYIRKLKDSATGVEDSDLIEMVSNIVSAFATSSEHKLSVLKAVKSNIVR